jgi:uncharacterized membrane protein
MSLRLAAVVAVLILLLGGSAPGPAGAQAFRGISLSTPYPNQTVRGDEPISLPLTVRNHGLPPQTVTIRVEQAASGWKATILGGGRPVGAVHVLPDSEASLTLRLEPPAHARAGTYRFRLVAQGERGQAVLPLALTLGQVSPARLRLTPELPSLSGPATTTFRYRVTLENQSAQDLLVNLEADAPRAFQVTFQSVGQQVSSLPVKAGESKDVDVEVSMPRRTPAGRYQVRVRAVAGDARAETTLGVEVTGRPDLSITTPDERLSGRATAGRTNAIKLVVKNQGSAVARNVELTASPPSGWEITFEPERIDQIPPDGEREVVMSVRPAAKAVAGDYMVTLTANTSGESKSADFRITVYTSTLWGLTGILLVAVALSVVGLAVARYGRR